MDWTVSKDRERLTIKFKPGNGDFGTGNTVFVKIAGASFSDKPVKGWSEWSVNTDP